MYNLKLSRRINVLKPSRAISGVIEEYHRVSTDVSEENIASIFRFEKINSAETSKLSSTLKMEAICSSETSVETQRTTRRHIAEDDTLHNHRCEKPQILHSGVIVELHGL
jgi:hypothetical protein